MKKLTLLLLIMLSINSIAQNNYFEKKLLWHFFQDAWIVDTYKDGYIISGRMITNNTNDTYVKSYLAFLNQLGDTTQVIEYARPNTDVFVEDLLQNNVGFCFLVSVDVNPDEGAEDHSLFIQTDTLGNFLNEHIISDTLHFNVLEKMVKTPEDGGYLAVGRIRAISSEGHKPYIVKLNSNGEKQWEKIINDYDPFTDNLFWDIVRTENGEYYTCGVNILVDDEIAKILLAKIDPTNGSIIEDWNYDIDAFSPNNQSYCGGMKLIALDDGGLLIGGQSEGILRTGILMRLNSNKDTVWVNHNVLNDCGPRKLLYLPTDSSFVTTGCATVLYPEVSNGVQVELSKVSSSGALLWKRHYGVDGYDDYAWDMISTPDGGFMVVGRSYSFFWQQVPIYLLKTNCMGLLTLPQASFVTQIDTGALRASFYNTSQFVYPDSIDGGHYLWHFGDGATSTQANPTHTYTQGGNYTVTLTAVVCSDTSVFVQEVSTWAVGIDVSPQPHASPQPPPKEGELQNLFSITPNPANGYLTITQIATSLPHSLLPPPSLPHSLLPPPSEGAGGGYEFVLYNMLGQSIIKIPLLTGGAGVVSTQVSLANIPTGVYLYQIINNNKNQTLQYGKVSIIH